MPQGPEGEKPSAEPIGSRSPYESYVQQARPKGPRCVIAYGAHRHPLPLWHCAGIHPRAFGTLQASACPNNPDRRTEFQFQMDCPSFSDEVSCYGKKGPVSGLHHILTARLIASLASDSARANLSCDNEPSARACLARCVDACDLKSCVRAAYSAGRPLVWGLISSRHSKTKPRNSQRAPDGPRRGREAGGPAPASIRARRVSHARD